MQDILKGEKTVASAMVKKYEKHKKDLKILRNAVRKYCTPEEYKNFFIEKITDTKKLKKSVNYVNYIGADGRGNTENLYNEIKKLLEDKDNADKDIQYILKGNRRARKFFCLLLRNKRKYFNTVSAYGTGSCAYY